jgi:hypothetical protein
MASNSCLIIACGTENDGTEDGVADDCASLLRLVTGLAGI